MAELIGALVEAIVGLIAAIAEALPAILEALAYVAVGAVTIIAYTLSRRFRERKQLEWKKSPNSKYLHLGISALCLGMLVALAGWIAWEEWKPPPERPSARASGAQNPGELQLTITRRSCENSNELTIAVPKGTIAKLLHKKARHQDQEPALAGALAPGTNGLQPDGVANRGQPIGSGTNTTSPAADSRR